MEYTNLVKTFVAGTCTIGLNKLANQLRWLQISILFCVKWPKSSGSTTLTPQKGCDKSFLEVLMRFCLKTHHHLLSNILPVPNPTYAVFQPSFLYHDIIIIMLYAL